MPARRKTTKKASKQEYPLLTLGEYEALSPQEKMRFLELLRKPANQERDARFDRLFEEAPKLIEHGMETFSKHFGQRMTLTRSSMYTHVGVLLVGTVVIAALGWKGILEGATVVAILGPLYTYVLVNLRYLTGWRVVGDAKDAS